MKVITDIYDFSALPCAATVGSFDGVHCGHRAMLAELRAVANEKGLPLMVVTFTRHPRLLFDGECEPFLLTTNDEKMALLDSMGVDYCVLLDFDSCMAAMSAGRFMKEVLVGQLGVQLLGVGYDHHFGKPAPDEGLEQYIAYGKELGVEVFGLSCFRPDGEKISSSMVRRALSAGDIPSVARLLGHDFSFSGVVVHGAAIGRKLGFPTANVDIDDCMKLLPPDGVYEVRVAFDGLLYKGVMNIGVKPTIAENLLRTIEVFIVDFSSDIYGCAVEVAVVRRLRGEMEFKNVEALRLQIESDVARVKNGN